MAANVALLSCGLHKYEGFKHIKTLVDVGGGVGKTLGILVSSYPQMHGINFDQPHVVAYAPNIPGIYYARPPPPPQNLNPTSFLLLIEAVFNSYAVFFFGQFCDVANAAMIHKKIQHMYLIYKTAFWLHIANQKKKAAKGT
jgi:hypothetical protein